MTKKDIDNIISIICPNDEDFEKPIISPAYLKKELEALALEQEIKSIDEREDVNGKVDAETVRTDIVLIPPVNTQKCDACEVGNLCLYCRHEFEPQERSGEK